MSCWKSANRLFVSGTAVTLLVLSPRWAKAIGPDYQYIPDAPIGGGLLFGALSSPTLNDIVDLGTAPTNAGEMGTGTVIGVATQGTTTYLSVLTALHVAVGLPEGAGVAMPGMAYFGAGFSGTAPVLSRANGSQAGPTNNGFLLSGIITPSGTVPLMATYTLRGQMTPEDMAVIQVQIPQQTPGSFGAAELSLITAATDVPTPASGFSGPAGAYASPVGYTQYGYGLAGIWNATNPNAGGTVIPANTYTAYNTSGPSTIDASGVRRFQNNQENTLRAPFQDGPKYFEPLTTGATTAPGGIAGGTVNGMGGTGFGGDSGGPLMTSNSGEGVYVTPNVFAAAANVPTLIPVKDTNSLSAVYVGRRNQAPSYLDVTSDGTTGIGQANYADAVTPMQTPISAVPLLTAAQTNTLTKAMPPMPGIPSPTYVYPGIGSLDWVNQYTTNGVLIGGGGVNGASGGPLAIPEPSTFSILALGGCGLLSRRRARSRSNLSRCAKPATYELIGSSFSTNAIN